MTLTKEKSSRSRGGKKAGTVNIDALAKLMPTINLSGINPTEFNVLVRPDEAEDTITFSGGHKLYKPSDTVEKERNASQSGTLVAVSPLAFTYERWPEGTASPQAGQKVIFAKYSGMRRKGRDGVEYLILKDKDIAATFDE